MGHQVPSWNSFYRHHPGKSVGCYHHWASWLCSYQTSGKGKASPSAAFETHSNDLFYHSGNYSTFRRAKVSDSHPICRSWRTGDPPPARPLRHF